MPQIGCHIEHDFADLDLLLLYTAQQRVQTLPLSGHPRLILLSPKTPSGLRLLWVLPSGTIKRKYGKIRPPNSKYTRADHQKITIELTRYIVGENALQFSELHMTYQYIIT